MNRALIEVHDLHYTYMRGTPLETTALRGVSFSVLAGEIVGVIGPTGSGKSTLLQHLNGLLRPQRGSVQVLGQDLSDPRVDLRAIRRRVALLFQNPEDQVFERYVADDVAFGPLSLGLSREEVRARVRRAMEAAGLPPSFDNRLTFALSAGERRRVALAGVLALEPEVLVLDEPLAGLDPRGRRELTALLQGWHRQEGRAVVWASHSMEEIAGLADRVYVLAEGQVVLEGPTRQVFARGEVLARWGLEVPAVTGVLMELARAGLPVRTSALTLEEALPILEEVLR
ncbi:MAG: ATP-binding cassette domain-containing protein [Chloroflexia bacterium]